MFITFFHCVPQGLGFTGAHTRMLYITNYLITESEVVTGKSQTEALQY